MSIFSAMTSYLMLMAEPNSLAAVYQWTIGTLDRCTWKTIPIMFIVVFSGSITIQYLSRSLDAVNSGDAFAKSVGINVDRIKIIVLLLVSLIAAGIVSFTGTIGFIGLVAPHIGRMLIGSTHRFLLPASALFGASLLLFADIVSHSFGTGIIPVGIVTAFIGGPMFLYLILRQKKETW